MNKVLYILTFLTSFLLSGQNSFDVTPHLQNMNDSWSIGNGCGEFNDEGYKLWHTYSIDLHNNVLQVLYGELTIHENIKVNGEVRDLLNLIEEGKIVLSCPVSSEYLYESVIIVLDETLSVEVEEVNIIKVFPNPASTYVNIKGINIKNITMYSLLGQLIFKINNPVQDNKIIITNYKEGIYIIHILTLDNKLKQFKLLIKT